MLFYSQSILQIFDKYSARQNYESREIGMYKTYSAPNTYQDSPLDIPIDDEMTKMHNLVLEAHKEHVEKRTLITRKSTSF